MTPWPIACQASLSVGFSKQEYWNGLPFPSQGDLPNPGIEPGLLHCRHIFAVSITRVAVYIYVCVCVYMYIYIFCLLCICIYTHTYVDPQYFCSKKWADNRRVLFRFYVYLNIWHFILMKSFFASILLIFSQNYIA